FGSVPGASRSSADSTPATTVAPTADGYLCARGSPVALLPCVERHARAKARSALAFSLQLPENSHVHHYVGLHERNKRYPARPCRRQDTATQRLVLGRLCRYWHYPSNCGRTALRSPRRPSRAEGTGCGCRER